MARKLAAILSTDVAGYSRLMGDDEEATIRTLTAYRTLLSSLIQQYRGRVVDAPGDNLLAEFASVVNAVRCAVEIQQSLKTQNAGLPEQRQMQFRIGINLGDVIVEGERLYGDGVNIAARLESLAEPGGICISGTVYDQVETKLSLTYDYQGEQTVKNITKPVRVYRIVLPEVSSPCVGESQGEGSAKATKRSTFQVSGSKGKGRRMRPTHRGVVVGLVLIAVTFGVIRYLSHPSLSPQSPALSPTVAPAALPLPDKPSLIVLPFVNMSHDPEQEYFSDGLTETLTSDLSRISSLFVIARNSAFTYKGKAVKVQDVGKEMGVRYVLEGSVLKADDQVRINAQLIDASTGYHLWSERYDRPLTHILTLQDEIVQQIVTTLQLQLTLQEHGVIVRKHTDNLEAYDALLRGQEAYFRYTKEANLQARHLYEHALTLDPQYAEAYVWLSFTYWREWVYRWSTDPHTLEQAWEVVHQALALDDALPAAHSAVSYIYAQRQQYAEAITEGERAIALDPNDADSYARLADVLTFAGRHEEVLQMMEQAIRLNPHYPPWYGADLGAAYLMTGRYAEAITPLQAALQRNPNHIPAHITLALCYLFQWITQQSPTDHSLELALAEVQRAAALNESLHRSHLYEGYILLYQRQYEQAVAEMERAVALAPTDASTHAALADVLSCMGRTEEAIAAAAQALRLQPEFADSHLVSVGFAYALAGHETEAQAPLQRYLSHYPNMLPAHLMLAAVYSELGQAAEAQKEAVEVLRFNPNFSLAVHKQRMPIKDPAVLERHIAALRKAGLK
ncbi:MAG TPA: tetratricopeptide repeat protein [Methylomirabilota bacterium]|nr:tetratricopeptide repeat protein [Methylomirabilota bacterium]